MKDLRKRFDRFCFIHRDAGIPNLMLYIILGNAVVILMSMINGGSFLYEFLCFDKNKILEGQIWRLITYVFTQSGTGFLNLIFLYFFYMLGRYVEQSMGTLKFNIFYFSGVLLMDVFAMIFCPVLPEVFTNQEEAYYLINAASVYRQMAYYLHLSLILTFATTHPDSQFMIFFIIPVKAWLIALVYLVLTAIEVINLASIGLFPHCLFPLVALGNYFLFTGGAIFNLLPFSLRARKKSRQSTQTRAKVVPFHKETAIPYTHKCVICGRTDITNPELEFRYCSRCKGYHCYCQDHIDNHPHVE